MAYKINRYSNFNVAEHNHGEWLLGLTDDYIKDTAQEHDGVSLTDDQCEEVAEWVEANMFDIILNACDDLGFMNEEEW